MSMFVRIERLFRIDDKGAGLSELSYSWLPSLYIKGREKVLVLVLVVCSLLAFI